MAVITISASCATSRSARSSKDGISNCLQAYGRLCARALARAHARSGDAALIAGYMGSNADFRRGDLRVRRRVQRPESAGLPGLRQGRPGRTPRGVRRKCIALRRRSGATSSHDACLQHAFFTAARMPLDTRCVCVAAARRLRERLPDECDDRPHGLRTGGCRILEAPDAAQRGAATLCRCTGVPGCRVHHQQLHGRGKCDCECELPSRATPTS